MTTLNRKTITSAYLFAAPAAAKTAYLMTRTKSMCLALIVVLLSPMAANAVPITYSFSTGSTPFGDPTLVPLFGGFSVTGTFDYDSDTPATTIIPSGPVAGSTLYLNSTVNLVGSVGAWSFSDPIGRTIVGNNKFQGSLDFLNLIADPNLDSGAPPSAFGLDGFDVDGFSLINVRMFWIQGQLGITDFLSNQDLPNPLPIDLASIHAVSKHREKGREYDQKLFCFWPWPPSPWYE